MRRVLGLITEYSGEASFGGLNSGAEVAFVHGASGTFLVSVLIRNYFNVNDIEETTYYTLLPFIWTVMLV